MCWYKLIFEQKQPIHIGKLKWGVISETEIFIPGWTMWGALVNVYIIKNKISNKNKIIQIQEKFETITNFFPSKDGKKILEPNYRNGKLYLGDYSEEEFRYRYVKADFKTSIEPILRKSKDEHLYEFEYIIPKFSWIGLVKLNNEYKNFFENLNIFIGGDVKYGYGLMEGKIEKLENENELEEWGLNKNGNLKNKKNIILRNFLKFNHKINFEGEIKLVPELNLEKNTPTIKDVNHFINVGSDIITIENSNEYKLVKGKFIESKF